MIAVVCYCYTINDWEEKLTRQINRIYSSGLYDNANELYLYISDPDNKFRSIVENILKEYPKFILDYTNINYGEGYLALCKVDDLARSSNDYKILYFHTKGVFNKFKNFDTKEINTLKISGVECWVELLEHFVIDKWKDCVDKLDEYDTVGVTNMGNWWWGNFWWVRSSHVQKNIPFKKYYNGSRWVCEGWLHDSNTEKNSIKPFEWFHFQYDPYYTIIPKYFYDGTDISQIQFNIVKAEYGYFAEQRDEGRRLGDVETKTIDVTDTTKELVGQQNNKRIYLHAFQVAKGIDPAQNKEKIVRITFRTNIDPENEYIISSFSSFLLDFGYKN